MDFKTEKLENLNSHDFIGFGYILNTITAEL